MSHIYILLLFIIVSCSRNHTLGTKDHSFGKKAKHIVWLQVDGLEEEHIALAKFASESMVETTPLEQMVCSGGMWDYNLFKLRPEPIEGFMSQILGSQKIKGDCSDLDRTAVWSYYEKAGYQVGIIEGQGVRSQSLLKYKNCSADQTFLKNSYFWSQSKGKENSNFFHFQEKLEFPLPGVFFDKSCKNKECFVSLKNNVMKIWPEVKKTFSKTFFVIRQSDFNNRLIKKDIKGARKSLQEIMEILNYFLPMAKSGDVSLIVTSAATQRFEFPQSGKDWASYEEKGTKIIYRKAGLMARAWSIGPGAENFCGTYEASDILKRFIWTPNKDIFYFSL